MNKSKIKKFIPENSSPMQEKFINCLMKDGKKSIARKIFDDTMKIVSKKSSSDPEKLFELAITNIKPQMEVKAKRIGGAVYQVPREVPPARQLTLAFRWILSAARGKKGVNMAQSLATEIIDASNETGSSIRKKEDTHKMAQANRAFAHFAKY
ncbi:MAG: 30S ribosomal protein S7 [Candidatus Gracilibacteria bacterium]|jgi:small subunit ribosomal protein S7|nr:30S ribosomal protein S7 [Candidatus Gracilibacteria bacterium]